MVMKVLVGWILGFSKALLRSINIQLLMRLALMPLKPAAMCHPTIVSNYFSCSLFTISGDGTRSTIFPFFCSYNFIKMFSATETGETIHKELEEYHFLTTIMLHL